MYNHKDLDSKSVKRLIGGTVALVGVIKIATIAYGLFVWDTVKKDKERKLLEEGE